MSLIRFVISGAAVCLAALACSSPSGSDPGSSTDPVNQNGNEPFSTKPDADWLSLMRPAFAEGCKNNQTACPADTTSETACEDTYLTGSKECILARYQDVYCEINFLPPDTLTCETDAQGDVHASWDTSTCLDGGRLSTFACQTKPTSDMLTPFQTGQLLGNCSLYCNRTLETGMVCAGDSSMLDDQCLTRCYTGSTGCLAAKVKAYICQLDADNRRCMVSDVDSMSHMDWTAPDCAKQEAELQQACSANDLFPMYN